jgi:chromosome segregation ATPase
MMTSSDLGGASPESKNLNMLTQMITQLEEQKLIQYEQIKQLDAENKSVQDKLGLCEQAREQAESTVVILEDERVALNAEVQSLQSQLGSLTDEKRNIFQRQLDDQQQAHELKLSEMKAQMSTVMEKVMAEWARVKAASRKSVAVEEWLDLEDQLIAQKNRVAELEEELAQGGAAGAAGTAATGPGSLSVPDPSVYGRSMGLVISQVDKFWQALLDHGIDWRTKGAIVADGMELQRAIQQLHDQYHKLVNTQSQIDTSMAKLVEQAGQGQIPDTTINALKQAVQTGFIELNEIKQNKALPNEIQDFMQNVISALDQLSAGMDAAEDDYIQKYKDVLEAEKDCRLKLQEKYSFLRKSVNTELAKHEIERVVGKQKMLSGDW